MTFELSPGDADARDRARAFAHRRLAAAAQAVDETAAIAPELMREVLDAIGSPATGAIMLIVTTEELAAVSPAVAAAGALAPSGSPDPDASGLRGLAVPRTLDARARLVLAAVALGIGRAAVEAALTALRDSPRGSHDQEKPHWVVADAATEVAAARLLTLEAGQALERGGEADGPIALAKLAAVSAARQAVDAALRVAGPEAFTRGALLERLSRDVKAVALLATEEELRATAASSLFPN